MPELVALFLLELMCAACSIPLPHALRQAVNYAASGPAPQRLLRTVGDSRHRCHKHNPASVRLAESSPDAQHEQ